MRHLRILLVDKLPTYREAQAMNLRKLGYEIEEASQPDEAFERAKEKVMDLALIDGSPNPDAYESTRAVLDLCEQLRPSTYCLVVTSDPVNERLDRWLGSHRIDGYQRKLDWPAERRSQIQDLKGKMPTNFELGVRINGKPESTSLWEKLASCVDAPPTGDELSFLFHRLFREEIVEIEIKPAQGGASGAGIAE